jgi:hypothetical protein
MLINLFPQRPDHPLADSKELKRILAELHVDKPANAVDEVSELVRFAPARRELSR